MAKFRSKNIYLSRYFDTNCQFIASMCPKCYEEQNDVKILGVNQSFLNNHSSSQSQPPPHHIQNELQDETFYFLDETFEQQKSLPLVPKEESATVHDIIFIPPRSPHNLIEETLFTNPWALLVATIFLNKTSCYQAGPYIFDFLKDYPSPQKVLESEPGDLEKYFTKLGLVKRSVQLWKMSHDFLKKDWKKVSELYGIGKYGEDAYQMFCRGNMEVEPKDRFLRIYKAWYEMEEGKKKQDDNTYCMDSESSKAETSGDYLKDEAKQSESECDIKEYKEEIKIVAQECIMDFLNNNFEGKKSKSK